MSATTNPFEPPKASLDAPVPTDAAPPLWNPDAAGAWSLLLSPIFGSVLVRKNWQALGETEKARAGTVWLFVSILMLIVTVFLQLTAIVYIAVWYYAFQRPQTQYIKERWGKDYPRKGWIKPLLAAVAVYILVVVLLTVLIVAIGAGTATK